MQNLIDLVKQDISAEEEAFNKAVGAYQARKAFRKTFPEKIRTLKKTVKVLNRAGISCKLAQSELSEARHELQVNEEILKEIRKHLQPGWVRIQERKEILSKLEGK